MLTAPVSSLRPTETGAEEEAALAKGPKAGAAQRDPAMDTTGRHREML